MINLLPPEAKQNLTYARRNTVLLHWAGMLVLSITGVGIIVLGGLFYIRQATHDYTVQKQKTEASLQSQNLDSTQKQVEEISSSLKLSVQVLSREVLFSKLIQQIGAVIPANASLTDLKIIQTQGGIDLTAIASDYNTATQVQVNLQDPANKIFSKADILNVTCGGTNSPNPRYPCTITIKAQFAKSNPFLFINTSSGSKGATR
jgi:Tfp pilus assembly protein PilN